MSTSDEKMDDEKMDEVFIKEDAMRLKRLPSAKTGVFWNVDDFPIPKEDIVLFAENIKKSLKKAGFHSDDVSIKAYGQNEPDELTKHHYTAAGITFAYRASKRSRIYKMLSDLLLWEGLASQSGGPTNVLLITKDVFAVEDFKGLFDRRQDFHDLQETNFLSYINFLFEHGPNIHFVLPDIYNPPSILLNKLPYRPKYQRVPIFNCIWYWTCLLDGGKPADYVRRHRYQGYVSRPRPADDDYDY